MKVHFMNLSLGCPATSVPWPAFPQAPVYPQDGQMQGEDQEGSRGDIVGVGLGLCAQHRRQPGAVVKGTGFIRTWVLIRFLTG